MSPTPNAKTREVLMKEINARSDGPHGWRVAWRDSRWGSDGQETPVGHVDLRDERPADRRKFLHGMTVRAEREEAGKAPGDLASTVVASPAMQRVLADEVQDAIA